MILKNAKIFGHVVCGVGERPSFANETFDVVISSQVLHHMANPQKALQEIFRCLKPRGYLLLAETVENNPLLKIC
jgi:ubiquinone/menaquinone biosynthesis C-methylase UbiE